MELEDNDALNGLPFSHYNQERPPFDLLFIREVVNSMVICELALNTDVLIDQRRFKGVAYLRMKVMPFCRNDYFYQLLKICNISGCLPLPSACVSIAMFLVWICTAQ